MYERSSIPKLKLLKSLLELCDLAAVDLFDKMHLEQTCIECNAPIVTLLDQFRDSRIVPILDWLKVLVRPFLNLGRTL